MEALTALLDDRKQIETFIGHPTQNARRYVYQFCAIKANQNWDDQQAMAKLLTNFFAQTRRIQWTEYLSELQPGVAVSIHTLFTFMILRCGPSNPLEHYKRLLDSSRISANVTLSEHLHEFTLTWDDYYDTLDCKEHLGISWKQTNEAIFFVEKFISTLSNEQQVLDLRQAYARKEIHNRYSLRTYIADRTYLHTLHQTKPTDLSNTVHHVHTHHSSQQHHDQTLVSPLKTSSTAHTAPTDFASTNPTDITTAITKTLEKTFDRLESKIDTVTTAYNTIESKLDTNFNHFKAEIHKDINRMDRRIEQNTDRLYAYINHTSSLSPAGNSDSHHSSRPGSRKDDFLRNHSSSESAHRHGRDGHRDKPRQFDDNRGFRHRDQARPSEREYDHDRHRLPYNDRSRSPSPNYDRSRSPLNHKHSPAFPTYQHGTDPTSNYHNDRSTSRSRSPSPFTKKKTCAACGGEHWKISCNKIEDCEREGQLYRWMYNCRQKNQPFNERKLREIYAIPVCESNPAKVHSESTVRRPETLGKDIRSYCDFCGAFGHTTMICRSWCPLCKTAGHSWRECRQPGSAQKIKDRLATLLPRNIP